MPIDITIPSLGESVAEGTIDKWLKEDGDHVEVDEIVLELETDKAAMEIPSPAAGKLTIKMQAGEVAAVGDVVGQVDESSEGSKTEDSSAKQPSDTSEEQTEHQSESKEEPSEAPKQESDGAAPSSESDTALSPAVRRLVEEHDLDPNNITPTGPKGNLTKADILDHLNSKQQGKSEPSPSGAPDTAKQTDSEGSREDGTETVPMSRMRQIIASRLVDAQQTAAILTTFNEVDMSAVKNLRAQYKEAFEKKHGVRLGFMSLFGKACIQALLELREVNARVDGTDIIYNKHVHLGIAVGTKRGLMVPVVRKADQLSLAELEAGIGEIATKARDGKITPDDLSGGTFTISNGGVYGSLLSTPILNPPQTGILGMHKIEDRAVVVDGEIVVRPMMYVALSYDHRLIDGEQAVTFLVRVKGYLEDPARMLLEI